MILSSEPKKIKIKTIENASRYMDMVLFLNLIDQFIPRPKERAPYRILYNYLYGGQLNSKKVLTITGAYNHLIFGIKKKVDDKKKKKKRDNRRNMPVELVKIITDFVMINSLLHGGYNYFIQQHPWIEKINFTAKRIEIKVPITWMVCYVNNIYPEYRYLDLFPDPHPTLFPIKPNEDDYYDYQFALECIKECIDYECSHICAEHGIPEDDEYEWHCMDVKCLTWESKSTNQSRGNQVCRKQCTHPYCKKKKRSWVCKCNNGYNGYHNPPCW
jgi:hypothetical protein